MACEEANHAISAGPLGAEDGTSTMAIWFPGFIGYSKPHVFIRASPRSGGNLVLSKLSVLWHVAFKTFVKLASKGKQKA